MVLSCSKSLFRLFAQVDFGLRQKKAQTHEIGRWCVPTCCEPLSLLPGIVLVPLTLSAMFFGPGLLASLSDVSLPSGGCRVSSPPISEMLAEAMVILEVMAYFVYSSTHAGKQSYGSCLKIKKKKK